MKNIISVLALAGLLGVPLHAQLASEGSLNGLTGAEVKAPLSDDAKLFRDKILQALKASKKTSFTKEEVVQFVKGIR